MGLSINVYRNGDYDCTNNGVSARARTMCLVNADGPVDPTTACPAVWVEKSNAGVVRIVPAELRDGVWGPVKEWFMMGGNYAASSDSRFSAAVERALGARFYGAVAIHDRVE